MIKNDRANYMTIGKQQLKIRGEYLEEQAASEARQARATFMQEFLASGERRPDRFFIDTLTVTGETFLIPASRRMEWQAFDVESEETAELLPVPEWAKPVAELSHVEFEMPQEVFK